MRRCFWGAVKVILLCVFVIGLVYVGSCIYANAKAMDRNPYGIPDAAYSVKVINTGLIYYTNGLTDSEGVVVMHGYWQLIGEKYKHTPEDSPPLVRDIFGPIEVRKRN